MVKCLGPTPGAGYLDANGELTDDAKRSFHREVKDLLCTGENSFPFQACIPEELKIPSKGAAARYANLEDETLFPAYHETWNNMLLETLTSNNIDVIVGKAFPIVDPTAVDLGIEIPEGKFEIGDLPVLMGDGGIKLAAELELGIPETEELKLKFINIPMDMEPPPIPEIPDISLIPDVSLPPPPGFPLTLEVPGLLQTQLAAYTLPFTAAAALVGQLPGLLLEGKLTPPGLVELMCEGTTMALMKEPSTDPVVGPVNAAAGTVLQTWGIRAGILSSIGQQFGPGLIIMQPIAAAIGPTTVELLPQGQLPPPTPAGPVIDKITGLQRLVPGNGYILLFDGNVARQFAQSVLSAPAEAWQLGIGKIVTSESTGKRKRVNTIVNGKVVTGMYKDNVTYPNGPTGRAKYWGCQSTVKLIQQVAKIMKQKYPWFELEVGNITDKSRRNNYSGTHFGGPVDFGYPYRDDPRRKNIPGYIDKGRPEGYPASIKTILSGVSAWGKNFTFDVNKPHYGFPDSVWERLKPPPATPWQAAKVVSTFLGGQNIFRNEPSMVDIPVLLDLIAITGYIAKESKFPAYFFLVGSSISSKFKGPKKSYLNKIKTVSPELKRTSYLAYSEISDHNDHIHLTLPITGHGGTNWNVTFGDFKNLIKANTILLDGEPIGGNSPNLGPFKRFNKKKKTEKKQDTIGAGYDPAKVIEPTYNGKNISGGASTLILPTDAAGYDY